jgi:hypothetical protein
LRETKTSHVVFIFKSVIVPLACGGIGGLAALAFTETPAPAHLETGVCQELALQVSSLNTLVNQLRTDASNVGPPNPSGSHSVAPDEVKQFAQGILQEAQKMEEQIESKRAEREVRESERNKSRAEVELVKLRNDQKTITLEQTKANVVRRLKRLGLLEPDLSSIGDFAAPYIRERAALMIQLFEIAAAGTKVSEQEFQEKLRPIDERFANALPANLDETTRHAIATELKSMLNLPLFFRD